MQPVSFTFLMTAGLLLVYLGAHEPVASAAISALGIATSPLPIPQRARAQGDERDKPEGMRKVARFDHRESRKPAGHKRRPSEGHEKNLIAKNRAGVSENFARAARLNTAARRRPRLQSKPPIAVARHASGESERLPLDFPLRAAFMRFEGTADWSIDDFEKIDDFYRRRFGHSLPVSAMGQSETHDRLGLDHRDAVDVALRPDSAEGRVLMEYMRSAGIPFIAFRGKFSSMSTGAHIHIGRSSPRLQEVRQRWAPRDEDASKG